MTTGRAARSELDALRALPTPRPAAVVDLLAQRLTPWRSLLVPLLAYGALAVTAVVLGASIAAMAILSATIEARPLPPWAGRLVGTVGLVAFAAAWLPAVWWVRRRRRAVRDVLATAPVVVADVLTRLPLPGGALAVAVMVVPGTRPRHLRAVVPATDTASTAELLAVDGADVAVVFPGGTARLVPLRRP